MAWTASVTAKTFSDGYVFVTVRYTDGVSRVNETYKSKNPTTVWIPDLVRNKLGVLATASAYDIPVGAITPSAPEPAVDANQNLFQVRCRLLGTVKTMIDMGAIQADNAKVVALVNWIKNNAATYFDSLV